MKLYPSNVRSRLTFWYVLFLLLILSVNLVSTVFLLSWHLQNQLFHDEIQDLETVEGLLYFDSSGALHLNEEYHSHPESKQVLDRYMEVLSPAGDVLYRNERLGGLRLGTTPGPSAGTEGYDRATTTLQDGTPVLFVSHLHLLDSQPLLIRVGYSLLPLRARVEETAAMLLAAFPLGIGLAGFAGYKLARRALDPLGRMAAQAELITANQLSKRLPVANASDELGQMAQVLNNLLERLENSFGQLRQFTADVSHELRTPLAAIRSVGEVGLQTTRSSEEYRETIGSMLEEVSRLTGMVETLLTISRADAGQIELHTSPFAFSDLVEEAAELIQVLADEKEQNLNVSIEEKGKIVADRVLMRLAVVNILHNAVRYSPECTPISASISAVNAENGQRWIQFDVTDNGPGIPAEARDKIFDRFYRLDSSRSQEKGGAGLGLAVAKWAVEMNGGHIGVEPTDHGSSRFFIQMPMLRAS